MSAHINTYIGPYMKCSHSDIQLTDQESNLISRCYQHDEQDGDPSIFIPNRNIEGITSIPIVSENDDAYNLDFCNINQELEKKIFQGFLKDNNISFKPYKISIHYGMVTYYA